MAIPQPRVSAAKGGSHGDEAFREIGTRKRSGFLAINHCPIYNIGRSPGVAFVGLHLPEDAH